MCADVLTHARAIAVNLLLVALIAAIVWMAYRESRLRVIVIYPIQVPEELSKRGYSPEVISNRIAVRLREIDAITATRMPRERAATPGSQVDIQIPGAGLGYRATVRFIKEMLGVNDIAVTGDVIQSNDKLGMRLVVNPIGGAERSLQVDGIRDNVEALLKDAGEELERLINPYVLAGYYASIEEKQCSDDRSKCDFSPSIGLYKQILQGDFRDAHKWALLGWSYVLSKRGEHELAVQKAERAAKLNPDFALAFVSWGNALSGRSRQDYKAAIEQYRQATDLDPKSALAFTNWGNLLMELKEWKEALVIFKRAIKADPTYALAYGGAGNALHELGRYPEASEKYRRASELDPKDERFFNGWGNALRGQKLYAEAAEKYERATELDPNYAVAFNSWGNALRELGRHKEAAEKFARVTEISPKYWGAYYEWARSLSFLHENAKAAKTMEIAWSLGLPD